MSEEPREIGRFAYLLKVSKLPDGNLQYEPEAMNDNIPIEIIIMQLKAFLNNIEKDYFDTFEKGTKWKLPAEDRELSIEREFGEAFPKVL